MILFRGRWPEIFLYYVAAGVIALFMAFSLTLAGVKAVEEGDNPSTAVIFFGQIIAATLLFLVLLHLLREFIRLVVAFLELLFLLYTSWLLLSLLFGPLGTPLSLFITLLRLLFPQATKNMSAAIIVGVVSGVVGASLSPVVALLLYVLLIVYDFVAVFITGHMVEMARGFMEVGNALGGGDFVLPTIFSTSLIPLHPLLPFLSFLASLLGLLFVIKVHNIFKRPLPALPYIGAVHITLSAFLSILLL